MKNKDKVASVLFAFFVLFIAVEIDSKYTIVGKLYYSTYRVKI